MTPPTLAALRFGYGLLTGAAAGFLYGFLRPLGRRHRNLADFLFVCAAFYLWLLLSFRLCRGDILAF